MTSASAVGTAVKLAQAVRPARIMMPGTSAPRNGSQGDHDQEVAPVHSLYGSMYFAVYRAVDPRAHRT